MVIGFIAMALIVTGALIGLALYANGKMPWSPRNAKAPTWPECCKSKRCGSASIDLSTLRMRDASQGAASSPQTSHGWPMKPGWCQIS